MTIVRVTRNARPIINGLMMRVFGGLRRGQFMITLEDRWTAEVKYRWSTPTLNGIVERVTGMLEELNRAQ